MIQVPSLQRKAWVGNGGLPCLFAAKASKQPERKPEAKWMAQLCGKELRSLFSFYFDVFLPIF